MAFFGMDERYAEFSSDKRLGIGQGRVVCRPDETQADQYLFHRIRPEDVVFTKKYTPEKGLYIASCGVVLPGCILEEKEGSYFPVLWLWRGWKHTVDPDDTYPFRGTSIYEEFDLAVQREILDLLPDSGHDPFKMVLEPAFGAPFIWQEEGNFHTGIENDALPYSLSSNT